MLFVSGSSVEKIEIGHGPTAEKSFGKDRGMRTSENQMVFLPYVADVLLIIFLMYVKSESFTLSRKCIKRVAGFKIADRRPSCKWGHSMSSRVFCSCFYEIELYPDIYDFIMITMIKHPCSLILLRQ